jgi:hypothetical protein
MKNIFWSYFRENIINYYDINLIKYFWKYLGKNYRILCKNHEIYLFIILLYYLIYYKP